MCEELCEFYERVSLSESRGVGAVYDACRKCVICKCACHEGTCSAPSKSNSKNAFKHEMSSSRMAK